MRSHWKRGPPRPPPQRGDYRPLRATATAGHPLSFPRGEAVSQRLTDGGCEAEILAAPKSPTYLLPAPPSLSLLKPLGFPRGEAVSQRLTDGGCEAEILSAQKNLIYIYLHSQVCHCDNARRLCVAQPAGGVFRERASLRFMFWNGCAEHLQALSLRGHLCSWQSQGSRIHWNTGCFEKSVPQDCHIAALLAMTNLRVCTTAKAAWLPLWGSCQPMAD